MEQTIKIGNKSVRLSNNVSWMYRYKAQFGKDIIPTVIPAVAAALDIISGLVKEVGKTEDITFTDLAEIVDGNYFMDAMAHIGALEATDLLDITWALAKGVDNDIPEPEEWVQQFEVFPLDVVLPAVIGLIARGIVSSKNLKWLENLKMNLQPSASMTSSLQEQSED